MVQASLLEYQPTTMSKTRMNSKSLKRKYSALVIDDQDNWRELLSDILEDQFEVTSVKDYESALDAIAIQRPPF